MSIGATVHSQAKEFEAEFERIWVNNDGYARIIASRLARNSRLGVDAADDIMVEAMFKVWRAYFRPDAPKRYEFRSFAQEKALVRRAIETAFLDLLRKHHDDDNWAASLDDPIGLNGSSGSAGTTATLADLIAAPNKVDDEVIAKVVVEEALNQKLNKTKSDGVKHVIHHLLVEDSSEDFETRYNANYISVTEHHLKKGVLLSLRCGDEG